MKEASAETLADILSQEDLACVYRSYDIVGSIAIIRLKEASEKCRLRTAKAVMGLHKNVKTVLAQTGAVEGDFRLRKLEYVGGEDHTVATHRESGCLFTVDVEKCYFSPRLSYERMRVAQQVGAGEVVVSMSAGVGMLFHCHRKEFRSEKSAFN